MRVWKIGLWENERERGREWGGRQARDMEGRITEGTGRSSRRARGMRVLLLRKEGEERLGGVALYKPQECRGEKVMFVHEIQMREEGRRKGNGRRALEMCMREGKEMGKVGVMLQVAYSNTAAREAYSKWGMTEGLSDLKEQEDGECYQTREVIWDGLARERLGRKREAEAQRRNMGKMRVRGGMRVGEEYQAVIRTEEEEEAFLREIREKEGGTEEKKEEVKVEGHGGREATEEGGRVYITTREPEDREDEEEEARRGEARLKCMAEDERWEERAVKRDEKGEKREWEIWYRGPGLKAGEADLWLVVKESKGRKGKYLMAGRHFKHKEAIVMYRGETISAKELHKREAEGVADHVMKVGTRFIDGRTHRCGGQYMNTAVWEEEMNNVKMMGAPHGTLRADKNGGIKKGEELLLDYGEAYWESVERQKLLQKIWEAG